MKNNNIEWYKWTHVNWCFNKEWDLSNCADCELVKRKIECILDYMDLSYGIIKEKWMK